MFILQVLSTSLALAGAAKHRATTEGRRPYWSCAALQPGAALSLLTALLNLFLCIACSIAALTLLAEHPKFFGAVRVVVARMGASGIHTSGCVAEATVLATHLGLLALFSAICYALAAILSVRAAIVFVRRSFSFSSKATHQLLVGGRRRGGQPLHTPIVFTQGSLITQFRKMLEDKKDARGSGPALGGLLEEEQEEDTERTMRQGEYRV